MSQLKSLHATFIVQGIDRNNYAVSKLISYCFDRGILSYASHLFHRIEEPNSFIYNTLVGAYSCSAKPHSTLCYFNLMARDEGSVRPNNYTLNFALLACGLARWVVTGRQMHGWVCKVGSVLFDSHVPTTVVRMHMKCGEMDDARMVFDEIPSSDLVQWNVIIDGYVKLGLESEVLRVFRDMLVLGVEPNEFCVIMASKACAPPRTFHFLVQIRSNFGNFQLGFFCSTFYPLY